MKRFNQKGMTTIEVLICFVIVVIITASMYSTISYYNNKRIIEGYKQQILSFKNQLTKDIQSDIIRVGLASAEILKKSDAIDNNTGTTTYAVDMHLRDSSVKRLIVKQTFAMSSLHPQGREKKSDGTIVNDEFVVMYGTPRADGSLADMVEYPLPDIGSYVTKKGEVDNTPGHILPAQGGGIAKDLSINNVSIQIIDEKILSIYIGFYHPDLGTRYGIDIVAPLDFAFSNQ